MRLVKDRSLSEVSDSEILSIAFEPRKKFIASSAFEEAVLIHRYPFMKLSKKIIHRNNLPINKEEIELYDENQLKYDDQGNIFLKGEILTTKSLNFSKDGKYLIIGYINGDILIYNTISWKKEYELKLPNEICNMHFVQDGKLLFVSLADWNLILIETTNWKIAQEKQLDIQSTGMAILAEDLSTFFIIADKKHVKAIDFDTLEEVANYKGHKTGINMIGLSPDQNILTTCGNDGKLCLFNAKTGDLISYLMGHTDEIHSFIFSEKGDYIVSSSEDQTVRLWDAKTFKCVKIMQSIPNAFAMRRYGDVVIQGNVEGEIQTFKMY
ncbi:MAG: hypothetical protein ACTSWL_01750 [Promethearchaeota archaeon]